VCVLAEFQPFMWRNTWNSIITPQHQHQLARDDAKIDKEYATILSGGKDYSKG
jgi:hypothetical protein